jgi:hypothetical protein
LVIHDAQFTLNEYEGKIGWGHSTFEYAVAMCEAAAVARLAFTHHDPLRTDHALEEIVKITRQHQSGTAPALEIFAAAEGQSLELKRSGNSPSTRDVSIPTAPVSMNPSLLMVVKDPVAASTIREAAQADDIVVLESGSLKDALTTSQSVEPSLIIAEWEGGDAKQAPDLFKRTEGVARVSAPIILVANETDALVWAQKVDANWLIAPFSSAYARARIQACLLRTACRWERAPTSPDEEQRLAALHALGILDTPAEERFDRITRMAASIFKVPMALVSFVDRKRQWFKSTYGLDVAETSRETSFCSHAVASREVLVVPDTFKILDFSTIRWSLSFLGSGSTLAAQYSWGQTAWEPCACWTTGHIRLMLRRSTCCAI